MGGRGWNSCDSHIKVSESNEFQSWNLSKEGRPLKARRDGVRGGKGWRRGGKVRRGRKRERRRGKRDRGRWERGRRKGRKKTKRERKYLVKAGGKKKMVKRWGGCELKGKKGYRRKEKGIDKGGGREKEGRGLKWEGETG